MLVLDLELCNTISDRIALIPMLDFLLPYCLLYLVYSPLLLFDLFIGLVHTILVCMLPILHLLFLLVRLQVGMKKSNIDVKRLVTLYKLQISLAYTKKLFETNSPSTATLRWELSNNLHEANDSGNKAHHGVIEPHRLFLSRDVVQKVFLGRSFHSLSSTGVWVCCYHTLSLIDGFDFIPGNLFRQH